MGVEFQRDGRTHGLANPIYERAAKAGDPRAGRNIRICWLALALNNLRARLAAPFGAH